MTNTSKPTAIDDDDLDAVVAGAKPTSGASGLVGKNTSKIIHMEEGCTIFKAKKPEVKGIVSTDEGETI